MGYTQDKTLVEMCRGLTAIIKRQNELIEQGEATQKQLADVIQLLIEIAEKTGGKEA